MLFLASLFNLSCIILKRRIIKKNINIKDLDTFDEILLVVSGKGVIKLRSISQIKWNNKSDIVF